MSILESFKAVRFSFKIRAVDPIRLPSYKGSALRGGFGHALKQVTCALRRQECGSCLLRARCIYLYLFETPPPEGTEMMRLYPSAPHPFIIEPPLAEAEIIQKGEPFTFGLVLIGRALDHLPYFVYAFTVLGERGLGRGRGKFRLEEVLASDTNGPAPLYDARQPVLRPYTPFPLVETLAQRCKDFERAQELTIRFHTPARIKFDGHLVSRPEFHHLIRALLRRLSSLAYFHCEKRLDIDFVRLIEKSKPVERTRSNLQWRDWERYSTRQKASMNLGGFTGQATFAGDLKEFLPVLALGELVHIGKGASFGLGRYTLVTKAETS